MYRKEAKKKDYESNPVNKLNFVKILILNNTDQKKRGKTSFKTSKPEHIQGLK